jgi:hypothetical protein
MTKRMPSTKDNFVVLLLVAPDDTLLKPGNRRKAALTSARDGKRKRVVLVNVEKGPNS